MFVWISQLIWNFGLLRVLMFVQKFSVQCETYISSWTHSRVCSHVISPLKNVKALIFFHRSFDLIFCLQAFLVSFSQLESCWFWGQLWSITCISTQTRKMRQIGNASEGDILSSILFLSNSYGFWFGCKYSNFIHFIFKSKLNELSSRLSSIFFLNQYS